MNYVQFTGDPPHPNMSELTLRGQTRLENLKSLAKWAAKDSSRRDAFYNISAIYLFATANLPVPPGQHAPLTGDAAVRFWGDYILSQFGAQE